MTHTSPDPEESLSAELAVAREAAAEAGIAAMAFYGTRLSTLKSDATPVTEADRASNRVILRALGSAFPGDAVLSEESRDGKSRLGARRVWIVDPLDGTREFLCGNGEFSVMIGLVIDGAPRLGVVLVPAEGTLYSAVLGVGAWVDRRGWAHSLICPATPHERPRLVGSRSHSDPLVERFRAEMEIDEVQPCGSVGLKCARIAEGWSDVYVHPVPYLKEWDTCAPEVILRAAGGWVSDCSGRALRYNKPDPTQPAGILAAVSGISSRAVAAMGRALGPAAVALEPGR
jgi:3'(2'), 5'-bisphosphate nucleotidase